MYKYRTALELFILCTHMCASNTHIHAVSICTQVIEHIRTKLIDIDIDWGQNPARLFPFPKKRTGYSNSSPVRIQQVLFGNHIFAGLTLGNSYQPQKTREERHQRPTLKTSLATAMKWASTGQAKAVAKEIPPHSAVEETVKMTVIVDSGWRFVDNGWHWSDIG